MESNNKIYDTCIIGAGFSGLVLAIKLARAGLLVCLVDLNRIVGRRILSTGNGRCNFTNAKLDSSCYFSNSSLDCIQDNHEDIIKFFMELGVFNRELDGYYYPITNQAKTIREALENEINNLEIDCFLDNRVTEVSNKAPFKVTTNRMSIYANTVVVSSGGLAAATLGSSKVGYKIAQSHGLKITKLAPSLVGLKSSDICLKDLAGVRALGQVNYKGHECMGEIQFNKDSVSGYPVMCISRFVGFDELDKNISDLEIDFLPFVSEPDLNKEILTRIMRFEKATIPSALLGLCNEKIIDLIIQNARIYSDTTVEKLDNKDIENLVYYFKHFSIGISGTKGFDNAQVTAGGVDLKEIDLNKMEAKNCKGIYFTGEVLDVDGICGGYNLTWAYTSADIAAKSIIEDIK